MDEKEYLRLKEEALAEYKRKVEAIETVWTMSERGTAPPRVLTIADAMREAIQKIKEPFYLWEIRNQVELDHPELKGKVKINTISGHLTRMHGRGELELVKKGSGTQPSSYKRAGRRTK